MPTWISHEPAVWVGIANAMVVLVIAFGVPITMEQKGAMTAVIAVLSSIYVRSQVTPAAKMDESGLEPLVEARHEASHE